MLGRHLLLDLYDCDPRSIADTAKVERIMVQAAKATKAHIVDVIFHTFSPQGVSGVVVIAESHLSIHSWPEFGFASVDIYTCGTSIDPWKAYKVLKKGFSAKRMTAAEIKRGVLRP